MEDHLRGREESGGDSDDLHGCWRRWRLVTSVVELVVDVRSWLLSESRRKQQ